MVISPGFASDCVETLEEISIQGKESFEKSGGEKFEFIPCLNDNDDHIKLLEHLVKKILKLMNLYLILKSLHLIAVISWMAGLLYLPRIFVYHVENYEKKEIFDIFEIMEKRLYILYNETSNAFSWIFGIVLIYLNGLDVLTNLWMQIKLVLVIILSIYHEYLGKCLNVNLKNRTNTKTAKYYRYINEVPTVLLILIVFVVIIKPL